jgi:HlyD family secretion protein
VLRDPDGERADVFVVDGARAHLSAVRLGHRGGARVEVLAGLREGDRVVLFPSDEMRDGVRVRAR